MWRRGPKALGLDRVDHRPHAGVEGGGSGDAVRGAVATLGRMLGGATLGRVDDPAREQGVAGAGEVGFRRQRLEGGKQRRVEMRLGEIEIQARFLEARARDAIGLGREQIGERSRLRRFHRRPCLAHPLRLLAAAPI